MKQYLYLGQYYFDNLFNLEDYPLPPLKKVGITDDPEQREKGLSGTKSHINYTHLVIFDCASDVGANKHEEALRAILADTRHGNSEWHLDKDGTLFNRFTKYCKAHGLIEVNFAAEDEDGRVLIAQNQARSRIEDLYVKFWELYIPKARAAGFNITAESSKRSLVVKKLGKCNFITVILNQGDHNLRVEVYNSSDPEKHLFDELYAHKVAIEQQLGYELSWQRAGSKDASNAWRIALLHPDADILDESRWEEYCEWSIREHHKLIEVFSEHLDDTGAPEFMVTFDDGTTLKSSNIAKTQARLGYWDLERALNRPDLERSCSECRGIGYEGKRIVRAKYVVVSKFMRRFARNQLAMEGAGPCSLAQLWDRFVAIYGDEYSKITFDCQVGDFLKTGRADTSNH